MVAERALEVLGSLGLGALLGWVLLPLLALLARQSRSAAPAAYHRLLSVALLGALLLALTPLAKLGLLAGLRGLSSLQAGGPEHALAAETIGFDWVEPSILPLARASHGMGLARHALELLGAAWLALWALGLVQLVRGRLRLGRVLRAAAPAPAEVEREAHAIARRLGLRPPRVRVSEGFGAPFATGFFSPVIGLDAATCALAPTQRRYALEHELCHIARGDTRRVLWGELARRCFAGHPSARWLLGELAWAREAAVDAQVAGDSPRGYACFLLAAAERRGAHALLEKPVFMADSALGRRIERLTARAPGGPEEPRRLAPLGAAALILGSLLVLAPASCGSALDVEKGGAEADPDVAVDDSALETATSGRLPPEQIRAVVRERNADLYACYAQLPAPRPRTGFDMHFVIGPDGRVSSGHVDSQPFVELGECGARVMRSFVFPPPESGSVSVVYPVVFEDAVAVPEPADTARPDAPPQDSSAGRLPRQVIRQTVMASFDRMRDCYEQLPERPLPAVDLKMHFVIGRSGEVASGHVDAEASPALGRCVDGVLRSLRFPAPEGGEVSVGYPIQFAPGDPAEAELPPLQPVRVSP